ncbi:MAG: hypothetical protein PW786_00085 [Arachidicoccus sp.]|nr:hypothetical protein [Arachidicoccus sp.]
MATIWAEFQYSFGLISGDYRALRDGLIGAAAGAAAGGFSGVLYIADYGNNRIRKIETE